MNGRNKLLALAGLAAFVGIAAAPSYTALILRGSTSGTVTLRSTAIAGSNTITLPARTSTLATTTGSLTNGDCAQFDASGNLTDAGAACGTGSSGLTINSTTITGGAAGKVLYDDGTKLQELAYGLTGNSTIVETTSGGLLTASLLPLATTGAFGAVKPDGTTITISGGVITASGASATSFTPGTTTIIGATAPCTLVNSASTTSACAAFGTGLTLNGSTLNTSLTDSTHAGGFSSWNIGGQDVMSASGTATFPALTSGQSIMLGTGSGAVATLSASGLTLNGLASTSTLRQFGFLACAFQASSVYDCVGFPGFGTITSGAIMKFAGADGAATAGDLSGDVTTSGSLVTTLAAGSASNLNSGTLAAARGGAGTINGALKGNGSGVVSQAACADLSNGATGCSTATGTSGATIPLLNGTNTFSGTQTFGAVVGGVNAQTGTTYTLAATDCGQTVKVTNASAITVTTFQAAVVGCSITVVQGGAGQITFANGGSATLVSSHSYTKTFNAAGATVTLQVLANAGAAAVFTLSGDGA